MKPKGLIFSSLIAMTSFIGVGAAHAQSSDDEGSRRALQEVVVTAQKRTQSLQKVAAAVTVLDAEVLVAKGVVDIRAAQMLLPSVRFQEENASTEIYIRGVGSTLDLPQIEPPTAINFNGIYIPREANSVPFFDIERLELLPGPQGTLYGRSALGGTVNVSFARPVFETETSVAVDVGNYALIHGTAVYNAAFSDKSAIRIAVDYTSRDGFMDSGANSRDDGAVRLSYLYDSDEFSAYLWGYVVDKNGKSPNLVNKGFNPNTMSFDENAYLHDDPWDDSRNGSLAPLAPFGPPAAEDQDYDNYAIGAELVWELSSATLTYVPSFLSLDWNADYWIGALPAYLATDIDSQSHELRLNGSSDRMNWIAGLNAYGVENDGNFIIAGGLVQNVDKHTLEGAGVFGQLTYDVTDTFRVTVGGRYSYDSRVGQGFEPDAFGQLGAPYTYDEDFNKLDWRVGVELDGSEDVMWYANVQTAYQPGTFNAFVSTPTLNNEVAEANLIAFSGGVKSRLLGGMLQINDEVFYYDYSDLFAQAFNASAGKVATFNAAKVEVYGNELDFVLQASDDIRLNLSVGYLHARNKDFVIPGVGGANLDGLQLQYAPDWTVVGGYSQHFDFGNGSLQLRADARYESSFWGNFVHTPGTMQDDYVKADASLTYLADSGWSLGLWIKNIGDEAVLAATAAAGIPGPASPFLEQPMTYGLRFTWSN